MKRWWRLLLWVWLLAAGGGAAWGAERFPPPEFEPGTYSMPVTTTPPARAHWLDYADVGLLLAALSAASYLVLVKRNRRQILGLMLLSLLYFGFVRKGCVCPIGSIQDVTLALFNRGYAVPVSILLFFLLPLAFTLFFGRTFCAAVCPLGAAQDLVLWRPVKVPAWLEQGLGLLPFVYLGAAVLFAATGSAFIICEYDPFVSFFRRTGSLKMLSIGAGFLLVGLFVGRPYCRFFCPYGAILGLLSRLSKWNVTLTPDDCIKCQLCDVACPFGAIAEPAEATATAPAAGRGKSVAAWIALLPVLVVGGWWLGGRLAVPLSQLHPTVRLAERIAAEETGKITDTGKEPPTGLPAPGHWQSSSEENLRLASKAFRQTGKPIADLYAEARRWRGEFVTGAGLLGAFVGLVIGGKLIAVGLNRKHSIYEPDEALCLACGRCYSYCPKELVRVKRLQRPKATPAPLAQG